MKKYINNKNLTEKCEKHNHKYKYYCVDCKYHLCKECLKLKTHKTHNKIILEEEQPNEEDINIIKDKIKYYNNKIQNIKENKIKKYKNEFKNNKIEENKRARKIIKLNKIQNLKELKLYKDKCGNI